MIVRPKEVWGWQWGVENGGSEGGEASLISQDPIAGQLWPRYEGGLSKAVVRMVHVVERRGGGGGAATGVASGRVAMEAVYPCGTEDEPNGRNGLTIGRIRWRVGLYVSENPRRVHVCG